MLYEVITVRERGAIVLSLCEAFPEAGLAPGPGEEGRGEFLSWLFYYQGVIEPVLVGQVMGVDHPVFRATFRGPAEMAETLQAALEKGPYLIRITSYNVCYTKLLRCASGNVERPLAVSESLKKSTLPSGLTHVFSGHASGRVVPP